MVRLTDDDVGKDVVDADGETIGVVSGIRDGTAYVDADPGITDSIMSTLGWDSIDEEDYPLDESRIASVTDDEVRLERDL